METLRYTSSLFVGLLQTQQCTFEATQEQIVLTGKNVKRGFLEDRTPYGLFDKHSLARVLDFVTLQKSESFIVQSVNG